MKLQDYDNHQLVTYVSDDKSGLKGFIALHRVTPNTPAFGATRIVDYVNAVDALNDALRLSKMMSYKAAMAGLKYGGAKGVIISPKPNLKQKRGLLKAYTKFINYLHGSFITGADAGLEESDVDFMHKNSDYIVGYKTDPVKYTGLGVYYGMQVCLKAAFGNASLEGRSVAIQGVGKIGGEVLKLIYNQAGKIYVSDPDTERIKYIKRKYPKINVVSSSDIWKQEVDIFSPNALGGVINDRTVSKLKCEVIAGGANNQLESPVVGTLLNRLGILYAPDYVINSGGLISVVDEYEHKEVDEKRIIRKLQEMKSVLEKIISISEKNQRSTNSVADEMAEKIFNNHK